MNITNQNIESRILKFHDWTERIVNTEEVGHWSFRFLVKDSTNKTNIYYAKNFEYGSTNDTFRFFISAISDKNDLNDPELVKLTLDVKNRVDPNKYEETSYITICIIESETRFSEYSFEMVFNYEEKTIDLIVDLSKDYINSFTYFG